MNTTLANLDSLANALIKGRFDRYVSEVRTLLTKVERSGWATETAAVRAELAQLSEGRKLPESFSTFRDLARLQAGLRRDVSILRSAAIVRTTRTQNIARPALFAATLNLSASSC